MKNYFKDKLVVSIEQAVAAPYCTAKLADAGAGVVKVPRLQGYDNTVVTAAGFHYTPTVASGTKADDGTGLNAGADYTCSEANTFGFQSENPAVYPSFSYNTSNGEKKCTATAAISQARGCNDGANW